MADCPTIAQALLSLSLPVITAGDQNEVTVRWEDDGAPGPCPQSISIFANFEGAGFQPWPTPGTNTIAPADSGINFIVSAIITVPGSYAFRQTTFYAPTGWPNPPNDELTSAISVLIVLEQPARPDVPKIELATEVVPAKIITAPTPGSRTTEAGRGIIETSASRGSLATQSSPRSLITTPER